MRVHPISYIKFSIRITIRTKFTHAASTIAFRILLSMQVHCEQATEREASENIFYGTDGHAGSCGFSVGCCLGFSLRAVAARAPKSKKLRTRAKSKSWRCEFFASLHFNMAAMPMQPQGRGFSRPSSRPSRGRDAARKIIISRSAQAREARKSNAAAKANSRIPRLR